MKDVEQPIEENTTSVAKGVFVFRRNGAGARADTPISKKKSRKRPAPRTKSPKKTAALQMTQITPLAYKKCWEYAEDSFKKLNQAMFQEVLQSVVSMVKSTSAASSRTLPLPTAALLTGVNLPDHEELFCLLRDKIKTEVSPHVASIRSTSAGGTNLRSMVGYVVEQLMLIQEGQENEDLDLKRKNCVFPVLEAWYNNQYPKGPLCPLPSKGGSSKPPPKKRARLSESNEAQSKMTVGSRPPLVIILEDFESFSSTMLQDFILNVLPVASAGLPVVLVMGVATSIMAVHRALPQRVSVHLAIEKFSGQKATEMLSNLVETILIRNDIHFKLGGKALDRLLQIFTHDDFSVKRFLYGYKFCLLEHFTSSVITAKLCIPAGKERRENIEQLSSSELDHCRALLSFRRYVEVNPKERARLLVKDTLFREFLSDQLSELDNTTSVFNVLVSCLFVITRGLPHAPLGTQMYSVYRTSLVKTISEAPEYHEAFQYLGHLSSEELHPRLKDFINTLSASDHSTHKSILDEGKRLLKTLEEHMRDPIKQNNDTSKSTANSSPLPKTKFVDRYQLKNQLLAHARDKKKMLSAYEDIRKDVLSYWYRVFSKHLKSPSSVPFYEIKFFDRVSAIKRHLLPEPRADIRTALKDPVKYLDNSELAITDENEIPKTFPDIGIVYKLHAEHGRLINVYDWLQSYISIVADDDDDQASEDGGDVNPILQARFTQAVSALQFLGFIKPSKRKTDHVAKLTWETC